MTEIISHPEYKELKRGTNFDVANKTEAKKGSSLNQDEVFPSEKYLNLDHPIPIGVFDGVGGDSRNQEYMSRGSYFASEVMKEYCGKLPRALSAENKKELLDLIEGSDGLNILQKINARMREVQEHGDRDGVGQTTATIGFLYDDEEGHPKFSWVNAGNGRIFLISKESLENSDTSMTFSSAGKSIRLLNSGDTQAGAKLKKGEIDISGWESGLYDKDRLTLALGVDDSLAYQPESGIVSLEEGDVLMVCTDGFEKVSSQEFLAKIMESQSNGQSAQDMCGELMQLTKFSADSEANRDANDDKSLSIMIVGN